MLERAARAVELRDERHRPVRRRHSRRTRRSRRTGPVYQDFAKFLPGLAGESRSFDANGQYFKVLGAGGAETLNLGNGLFGTVAEPIVGINPPPTATARR